MKLLSGVMDNTYKKELVLDLRSVGDHTPLSIQKTEIKQKWEEVRVPGGNPSRCIENMQGPHRKAPAWNQTQDLPTVRRQC